MVTHSDITPSDIEDHGPVEREVRLYVTSLGTLTGVKAPIVEICYALARDLDTDGTPSRAAIARELATRLETLEFGEADNDSPIDEITARRQNRHAKAA